MKHLLPLLFLVLSSSAGLAQSVVRVDILPPQGLSLDKGWMWHAGDNPDWAKPAFDDSQWETIDPTKDIMALPAVRRAGTGWFRLHLVISPSVLTEPLALLLAQTGASDVYVNGRLLYHFGQIDTNGQTTRTYNPRGTPVSFSTRGDSRQTLVIRFACANNLLYTTSFIVNNPVFQAQLNGVTNAVRYHHVYHLSGLPLDYAKFGIFFILTILHLALYLYYPIQRANLYFSLFSLGSMVTYFLQTQVGPHPVATLEGIAITIGILTNLGSASV